MTITSMVKLDVATSHLKGQSFADVRVGFGF